MGRRSRGTTPREQGGGDTNRPGGKGLVPSLRPSKICPVCERPFSWRRKWASVWDEVIYCSDRCRARRSSSRSSPSA